jgi:hypothetical protein
MLYQAYPEAPPRVFGGAAGSHYVTGPGLKRLPARVAGAAEHTDTFRARGAARAEVATDDWPFFYMQERTYPVSYLVMIAVLLALSAWLVRRRLGALRPGAGGRGGTFFFLGAGFMLVETKGVTELGLVFGNTWQVLGVVVAGVLVMVYLANRWVLRRGPVSPDKAFALLGASLALGWVVNRLALAGLVVPAAPVLMPVVLTLPLLFAGLIFSGELAGGEDLGAALSANLFGAMLGGFLEYNSMYWGFSSLYPLGLGLYGLAFLCGRGRWRAQSPGRPVLRRQAA